jgi:hypothetical protein
MGFDLVVLAQHFQQPNAVDRAAGPGYSNNQPPHKNLTTKITEKNKIRIYRKGREDLKGF